MEMLYIPKQNFFEVGKMLLTESLKQLSTSFKTIVYHFYENDFEKSSDYKKLFSECHFHIKQQKLSFIFKKNDLAKSQHHLIYKSFNEVGKKTFIQTILKVTQNTLDQDDIQEIEQFGEKKAAMRLYHQLLDIDENVEWWKLAYTKDQRLIGLIIPQKLNQTVGAINYIGVVPEERGNGYVQDLLIEGTRILLNNHLDTIIADIDIHNFPMEQALKNVGYHVDGKMINYYKKISKE